MKTTVFKLGSPCGDTPEMTKPPEGGLSPQEHQAKPDGQGGSCIFMISDYLNNNNPKPEKPATKGGCLVDQPFFFGCLFTFDCP